MRRIALVPFVISVFLSAFLLFLIQPLVTRMLLPLYGGSPAVWNTALVFFQVVLLLGYLYAHGLVAMGVRPMASWGHLAVLALPLLVLPPRVPDALTSWVSSAPALSVLLALAVIVGLPFFTLSTNSSLIQHWWAETGRPGSEDPYWLYGASNTGSLLALLAYPFLVVPMLDLETQSSGWSVGYGLFVLMTSGALIVVWRARLSARSRAASLRGNPQVEADARGPPVDIPGVPSSRRILFWVFRTAVASSLLLSITMRISMDVGSVPLFWVLPLAVYLLTFILAFSLTDRLNRRAIKDGTILFLFLSLGLFLSPEALSFWPTAGIALLTLFVGSLFCHHELALDRPMASHLTLFYLWIAVGGALGGILNSLVAPVVFDSVAEYPITLIALAALLYLKPGTSPGFAPYRLSMALGFGASLVLLAPPLLENASQIPGWGWIVAVAGTLLLGVGLHRYVGGILVVCLLVVILDYGTSAGARSVIAQKRSFFGVVRVLERGDLRTMMHGTTVHGVQNFSPELRRVPLGYYHPTGPLGAPVSALGPGTRVGVVGLGTGALAAAVKAEQEIVFHEIDPLVVEVAQSEFTYLSESPGLVRILLGDGRLTLSQVPDGEYDLLIVDAYSSDFIPLHLLTTQAFSLYLRKVKPRGVVLLHISNRHVDLPKVVKGNGADLDVPVRMTIHNPPEDAAIQGAQRVVVAALARTEGALDDLESQTPLSSWHPPAPTLEPVVWTDSRASLVTILK